MLGLSVLDSQAARWLLRFPFRSRQPFSSRVHSSSSSSSYKLPPRQCIHTTSAWEKGGEKPRSYQRSGTNRDNRRPNNKISSRGNDIQSLAKKVFPIATPDTSTLISKDTLIRKLVKLLEEWPKDRKVQGRIDVWGIKVAPLSKVLSSLAPDEPRVQGKSRNVIIALLELWSKEAIVGLETESSNSSTVLDLENAQHAYEAEGSSSFNRLLMNSFLRWLEFHLEKQTEAEQALSRVQSLLSMVDLRHPSLLYPEARNLVRQIHLHVGPTNSGKTHGALMALCKANTGIYAGPLRLLAHEVWERINSGTVSPGLAARPCNLLTGEEVKTVDELAGLTACTVEMVNYSAMVDVAVIDEIQMIGDAQRGSAWTNAVLGLRAKELHLCGESSVVPLIKQMAEACGDEVYVHEYKRLTPLQIGRDLQGQLSKVKKGDCVVAFSRTQIFRLKELIESLTGLKCALAYGALPPETKSEQAKKFNDPDNDVSVMVASDAIGMGLNLKIKRIIFSSVTKWNGSEIIPISTSQLKQIAGRAGRYGTTDEEALGGFATTLYPQDLPALEAALEAPLLPITRAALSPSSDVLANLATTLPGQKRRGFSRELASLFDDLAILSQINSRMFFLGSMEQQYVLAPLLEDAVPAFQTMAITEREKFAIAPANHRDERLMALLANIVGYYARGALIKFKDVDSSLQMLDQLKFVERIIKDVEWQGPKNNKAESFAKYLETSGKSLTIDKLMVLESLHRGLTLYLWLSYRFPLAFCYKADVEDYKQRTEKAIDFGLEAIKAGRAQRLAAMGDRRERYSNSESAHRFTNQGRNKRQTSEKDSRESRGSDWIKSSPREERGDQKGELGMRPVNRETRPSNRNYSPHQSNLRNNFRQGQSRALDQHTTFERHA